MAGGVSTSEPVANGNSRSCHICGKSEKLIKRELPVVVQIVSGNRVVSHLIRSAVAESYLCQNCDRKWEPSENSGFDGLYYQNRKNPSERRYVKVTISLPF